MSNSSMNIFPENTTASFSVLLPQKVSLKGNWSVGLAEIHFSYNFFNVSDGNNTIIIDCREKSENEVTKELTSENVTEGAKNEHVKYFTDHVENGFYNSVQSLIDSINRKIKTRFNFELFAINDLSNRTVVLHKNLRESSAKIKSIYLQNRLAMQLGFEPNKNVLDYELSPNVGNIHNGIADQMLIYTDVVEPVFIGHEKANVLKIVNTTSADSKFGDSCYREFHHIHYTRLQKREIETISIDIRDYSGKQMPFLHGVSSVKLHFLKKN